MNEIHRLDPPPESPIAASIEAERLDHYRHHRATSVNLAVAIEAAPRDVAVAFCAAALDHLGAGQPIADSMFSDLRADADFWASIAGPHELREYIGAGVRRLMDRDIDRSMALGPRKKLLVALFQSLPPEDRRAFLERVDPGGEFRGAA